MSEFQAVSESELQSIEGGVAPLVIAGVAFLVGVAIGFASTRVP